MVWEVAEGETVSRFLGKFLCGIQVSVELFLPCCFCFKKPFFCLYESFTFYKDVSKVLSKCF